MKLSKKYQYGILLVLYLLRSGRTSMDNIATNLGLSKTFLQQVALVLNKNGIISSKKGPSGGYELTESIKQNVTVMDVLKALGYSNSLIPDSRRNVLRSGTVEQRALSDFSDYLSRSLYTAIANVTAKSLIQDLSTKELDQLSTLSEAILT